MAASRSLVLGRAVLGWEQVLRQEEPGRGGDALRLQGCGREEAHCSPGKACPAKHNLAMERRASCQEPVRRKALIQSTWTKNQDFGENLTSILHSRCNMSGEKQEVTYGMGRRNLLTPSSGWAEKNVLEIRSWRWRRSQDLGKEGSNSGHTWRSQLWKQEVLLCVRE